MIAVVLAGAVDVDGDVVVAAAVAVDAVAAVGVVAADCCRCCC